MATNGTEMIEVFSGVKSHEKWNGKINGHSKYNKGSIKEPLEERKKMAMNGTEMIEIFPAVNSHKKWNGKINEYSKYNKGSIKEPLRRGAISKDAFSGLPCFAKNRRVHIMLYLSLILNAVLLLTILLSALLLSERGAQDPLPDCSKIPVESCPDGWVGYRRKCYYFAEAERNWTSSQRICSSFNASLAVVDSQDEMDFLRRYKTSSDHWIGLQRDLETNPWKWINGTIFNNWFQVRGGGECAYINHKGVGSSFCTREEPCICSKPLFAETSSEINADFGRRDQIKHSLAFTF